MPVPVEVKEDPGAGRGGGPGEARLRRASERQRGAALIFSLVVVLLIASLGAGLIQLQTATQRSQNFAIDRRRALYLAEAGLGEAALAVSMGKSGIIASEACPASFGGGLYWVESDDLPDDRMMLTCTAQVASAEIVARTLVIPNVNPVARLGFFGANGVELGAGTIVDGYHSGRGSYASQVDPSLDVESTGGLAVVSSDRDVALLDASGARPAESETGASEAEWEATVRRSKGSNTENRSERAEGEPDTVDATRIYGEVRPGRTAIVASDGSALITGGIRPFQRPPLIPEIALPSVAEVLVGDVDITALQVGLGASSQTDVQGVITVKAPGTLRIEGPAVLVTDRLVVEAGGTVEFDDALGPIQLFLRDGMEFQHGSFLSSLAPDTEARGTRIFVAGTAEPRDRVFFWATGRVHALLYAPDDVVSVPANLHWVGGIAARILRTEPCARLTIDRRLAIGGDGLSTLPELLAWQLIPLGDAIARPLGVDPILALRLRGVTPLEPGEASPEDNVTLQYVDAVGQPATFVGPISSFNPAHATEIIGARWDDPRDGAPREWATPPGTESTDATERVRSDLAAIRGVLLREHPGLDVAALTTDEVVVEAAALPTTADLSGAPQLLERVQARAEPVDAATQAERDKAAQAGRSALTMAMQARMLVDDAKARSASLLGADLDRASAHVASMDNDAIKVEEHAKKAKAAAIGATTATGAQLLDYVDEAIKQEEHAQSDLNKVEGHDDDMRAEGF